MSRVEISKIIGINTETILRYESKQLYGNYDKLIIFAELYGTTVDFLLERTNCPYKPEFFEENPVKAKESLKVLKNWDGDLETLKEYLPPLTNQLLIRLIEEKASEDTSLTYQMVNDDIASLNISDQKKVMRMIEKLKSKNHKRF